MSQIPAAYERSALRALASVACLLALGTTQSQEVSFGPYPSLSESRDELRQRVADFEQRAAIATELERQAFAEVLRARLLRQAPNPDSVSIRSATDSVAATARCESGYVLERRHSVSADVTIVSAELLDCDQRGCRAYEVSAAREGVPFDLNVSVVCST